MTKLVWNTVNSSNLKSYAYDDNTLYVKFTSGTIYKYLEVPSTIADRFEVAESKGKFLNTEIKKNYKYEKLETQESS